MTAWPDVPAEPGGASTVRSLLDYIVWVSEVMEKVGAHGGLDLDPWRQRVHKAYLALVDSMVPGHGDPLPPDVPPSVAPGTWPDIAAATVPGMTVRHQLTVMRTIAMGARTPRPHQAPPETERWAARVREAFTALDHGPAMPMPEEAKTAPPPPPPSKAKPAGKNSKKKSAKKGSRPARKSGHGKPRNRAKRRA